MGAEPQPEGINVIERHVGQKKWTEAATIRQSQEASGPDRGSAVLNTKGKGRGKSRGRGRGGVLRGKGAVPAEAAGASQQNWGPITEEFRAAESKLQAAIEKLMPQIQDSNTSLRSLKEKVAKLLGWQQTALAPYKDLFKSLVREWLQEHLCDTETGLASEDFIEASQRLGCAAQVSDGTPHTAKQLEVSEVSLVHSVSPAIAVLLHGSASTKKSFTCELTTDFMTKSPHAPTCIADGDAFMVEASSKGIRVGILHNDRVPATTDEVVNTFPTPWGDHQQAHAHVNHLPRSKCNTWTQGERDDVCTANGTIHLKGYTFQLKAFGQNEACERVWQHAENGWQKRLSVAISPNKNPIDEETNADFSMGVMQGFHDWMFQGHFSSPQYPAVVISLISFFAPPVVSRVDYD